jgi:hypothetical protein
MSNTLLQIKVKERLNKLSSNDYDNVEGWQIVEAFNKFQLAWCRDRIKEDEGTKKHLVDLEVLLTTTQLLGTNKKLYFETVLLPEDFFEYKRTIATATHPDCELERRIKVTLENEGDVDELLGDDNARPDFDWAETFATLVGGRLRIYTDERFAVQEAEMLYYRYPKNVLIAGTVDPSTGQVSPKDVVCEFKRDVFEILVDGAAGILAGDIESFNQTARLQQAVVTNTK